MEENKRANEKGRLVFVVITILLIAMLGGFIYIGHSIWNEYKKTIINNQKDQMLTISLNIAENLEAFIEEYQEDLDMLGQVSKHELANITDREWDIFVDYVETHKQFVYDVWIEDQQGKMVRAVTGYEPTEYSSIIPINDQVVLAQCRMQNQDIALVIRKELNDGNSLAIVINADAYYQNLISSVQLGKNGYIVIKDSQGIVLMHPEKNQWGIAVIEGRKELYSNLDLDSLEAMIEKQNRGETGVAEYYSYWWSKPDVPRVKKIGAYCPTDIGDSFIVVSAVIDYDDIYIPVVEVFLKLILVFLGILAVICGMGFYIVKLMMQQQKVTEEIIYLRELNRVLEDMHQSEELIAHQQRLQIMGTMTGGIAHEFNNLLTPIMGYAELLMLELSEESSMHEDAFEIYEASLKAKEIIQQLSSLSRKNIETAYKNIRVARMLQRALKMVQSVCPVNVRMNNNTNFSEESILGNETQLNQVILNICVNAIHAIGHQDGEIAVAGSIVTKEEIQTHNILTVQGDWQYYVKIDISDNGCGMSEDTMKKIFDPFFTTKKGGVGTGLGLSLVEQIITSHKGYIFVESELEAGSTFHIYIPLNERKDEYLADNNNEHELTLMVVDDNPKVLQLLERSFAKRRVEFIPCLELEEAKSILEKQLVDALIIEPYIDGNSGIDFFMYVLAKHPGVAKIMMSDFVTKEIAEAKRRGIIDSYIDKPVSDTSIMEAVIEWRKNLNKY